MIDLNAPKCKYTPEEISKLKQMAASFLIRQRVFQERASDEAKVIAYMMADHTESEK